MRLKLKLKDKELFLDEEAWIKEQNWREERTRIVHNQMVDFLNSLNKRKKQYGKEEKGGTSDDQQ